MNDTYFVDHLSITLDFYSSKYDRIVMGDFNLEPCTPLIKTLCKTLCNGHNLHNLIKENTCFKGEPKCYNLILTNCKFNFQNTVILTSGFSDFHKMTVTVLKTEYVKADPIQINYRNYTKFNPILFQEEPRDCLYQDAESMKTFPNFQVTLCMLLNKHAPLKKKYLHANDSPFMTKPLRKLIMNR